MTVTVKNMLMRLLMNRTSYRGFTLDQTANIILSDRDRETAAKMRRFVAMGREDVDTKAAIYKYIDRIDPDVEAETNGSERPVGAFAS